MLMRQTHSPIEHPIVVTCMPTVVYTFGKQALTQLVFTLRWAIPFQCVLQWQLVGCCDGFAILV